MRDLVSYEQKHNIENGEWNRDGVTFNDGWNCGVEGFTHNPEIESLRIRQIKNFCIALMTSCGVPMILSGDEYGHTKLGNNNTWCQDNALNWFQWQNLEDSSDLVDFWTMLINFRKDTPQLCVGKFLTADDIQWHEPDWTPTSRFVAYTLIDHEKGKDIFIAFNTSHEPREVELPKKKWSLIAYTAGDLKLRPIIEMAPYSSLILRA
jgi:isoamylase/glycogen operon protein